jgi:hypothetical protein
MQSQVSTATALESFTHLVHPTPIRTKFQQPLYFQGVVVMQDRNRAPVKYAILLNQQIDNLAIEGAKILLGSEQTLTKAQDKYAKDTFSRYLSDTDDRYFFNSTMSDLLISTSPSSCAGCNNPDCNQCRWKAVAKRTERFEQFTCIMKCIFKTPQMEALRRIGLH